MWIALLGLGCALIARYSYQAETRVQPSAPATALTEADLQRADVVAAEVARSCGLRSGEEVYGSLEGEDVNSAMRKPPREFLRAFARKLRPFELPIELRLEVSEDRRTLYFTAADFERGSPEKELDCLREGLKKSVDREFAGMSIVHEVNVVGPLYSRP